jgi:hypothetical protein
MIIKNKKKNKKTGFDNDKLKNPFVLRHAKKKRKKENGT